MVMKCIGPHLREVDRRALQTKKIKEIGYALVASGLVFLDQQANALGISRSTAWTILRATHKTSGLTAIVINQMLMAPQLPPFVRAKLFEYIEGKIAGAYGHSPQQVRRFAARLIAGGWRSHVNPPRGRRVTSLPGKELSFSPKLEIIGTR
jgi:hypothetical protein